jgi:hypothetical protein
MKLLWLAAAALLLAGCSASKTYPEGYQPPTEVELTQALKDALSLSVVRAIARASALDGFYADLAIRIEPPGNSTTMQKRLREIGLGPRLDRSTGQMNRIAEDAAGKARPVFIKSITALDIDDPYDLLQGNDDASTNLLRDEALDDLYRGFRPIIDAALQASNAEQYYLRIVERHNALPLSFDIDADLGEHLTRKTIDGLLFLMAQEEARIRGIPSARSTQQIHRVFRILD